MTGAADGLITVWKLHEPLTRRRLDCLAQPPAQPWGVEAVLRRSHNEGVLSLAGVTLAKGSKRLCSGALDGTVCVWMALTEPDMPIEWVFLRRVAAHDDAVGALAVVGEKKEQQLISAGDDALLKVWPNDAFDDPDVPKKKKKGGAITKKPAAVPAAPGAPQSKF